MERGRELRPSEIGVSRGNDGIPSFTHLEMDLDELSNIVRQLLPRNWVARLPVVPCRNLIVVFSSRLEPGETCQAYLSRPVLRHSVSHQLMKEGIKKGFNNNGRVTYVHSQRDRIPDALISKHTIVAAIKTTIAHVQGVFEADSFENDPSL